MPSIIGERFSPLWVSPSHLFVVGCSSTDFCNADRPSAPPRFSRGGPTRVRSARTDNPTVEFLPYGEVYTQK